MIRTFTSDGAWRNDQMPPYGYRSRSTVAYLGVNYPIEDGLPPNFTDVPSAEELFKMLKRSAPDGVWHLRATVTGFTVDPNVARNRMCCSE